jgi:LytS/YehU family sensor histidine kinase
VPIVATIFSFSLCAIYEGVYIYQKLQESVLEAQKFQTEHIKSQFEVLKNQIDPHFLFNSLNTLASIITEKPHMAVDFAEKLSQVYRYILQNKDKEVVALETEINFVKSYVFLLQTRFEQNLIVNFEVGEAYLNQCIPPLSLQILVENAIKHNVVSQAKPLRVDIFIDRETSIVVRNNLQPKRHITTSNKIGLDNIIKRYQYLTNQSVEILPTPQDFKVALPLLSVSA